MTAVTSAVRTGRVFQGPSWRPRHDGPSWRLVCRRLKINSEIADWVRRAWSCCLESTSIPETRPILKTQHNTIQESFKMFLFSEFLWPHR